ncbi:hypothetical protein ACFYNZ_09285 [Streptomyces kebangsaanensis]|uniref:Integral membrane protein n=1 Tax=Streptomyces kebangsaanensis TaxID=864058 RepID=A0ABW6KP87_9ACTN
MIPLEGRSGRPSTSLVVACVRAGLFALAGSVLAALGHHTVADGAVPWRLVALLAGTQFAVVWPAARRRFSLASVVGGTLAAQGVLHLVLTLAGGRNGAATDRLGHGGHAGHVMHAHAVTAEGNGSAWHQTSAAMTAVHVLAGLAVAWLLHRADAAVAVAVVAARALAGAATAVAALLLPPTAGVRARTLPVVRVTERFAPFAQVRTRLLWHALVRRGPPGRSRVPTRPSPGRPPRAARHHQQGATSCPSITPPAPRAVSPWPAPPR